MKLLLTCDGSRDSIVRCCQGAALVICTEEDLSKFHNKELLLEKFKDNKLTDHLIILELLISLPQIKPNFPLLDIIDFFAYHRPHTLHMEISND